MSPNQTVWLPVEDTPAWVRATVEGPTSVRRLDNGELCEISADKLQKLSTISEASSVDKPPVEDLTQLESSSDATFLDALRRRYANDEIYTAIGPVIISINPYKQVSGCTSEAISQLCKLGVAAPPHVARAATVAFKGMTQAGGDSRAQSILISGESGAGKTEACKLCLLALAELSSSSGQATEAALESAELLEAFGNAKTVYNENSSRFGKWCAVYFDRRPHIASCATQVYLLEKTRIIGPPPGERNFHIFYQMLAGASADERALLQLGAACGPDHFEYVRRGVHTIDGVDDAREWAATLKKLEVLGIGGARQVAMLRLFAAVLAVGNLAFAPKAGASDGAHGARDAAALATVASLLEVEAPMLESRLCARIIDTGKGSSTYTVQLSAAECADSRDALAKALYVELFLWIVGQLNEAQRGDAQRNADDDERFVGLLDIFGFENFRRNSFEQLCINFTNEKLQAHFMDALVKLKLLDYQAEGIDCTAIDFPDNVAQIQLIDHKSRGLFALLDDECSVPQGNEQQYVDKLHRAFQDGPTASACYDQPRRAKGGMLMGAKHGTIFPSHGAQLDALSFVVVHYAEQVMYTAERWLDKNRGYLHPDVAFVLTQSKATLTRELFPPSSVDVAKKSTVSSTFRRSLRELSTTMLQTSQHYLRCIKPNGQREPDALDGHFVLRQLRYTGVASVVEIQRSGYPIALSQMDFIARYRCIAFAQPQILSSALPTPQIAINLLRAGPSIAGVAEADWLRAKDAQVGKTRVFLRENVARALETPRLAAVGKAAVCMQRYLRGCMTRRVTRLMLMHVRGAAAVRARIAEADVAQAGAALDALAGGWKASSLEKALEKALALSALLPPLHAELAELEQAIASLESGLEAEAEALDELRTALAAASESGMTPKQAYVQLKVALHAAVDVSRGLRPELTEAIATAEGALSSCLQGLGLSPDAARAALANLRKLQSDIKLSRASSASVSGGGGWQILTITLANDADTESSSGYKQLVGYSLNQTGVGFNERNGIFQIRAGSLAAREGALHVGDVVLSVDGSSLRGERVPVRLNANKKKAYQLTVARSTAAAADAGVRGEYEGWVMVVKAKEGSALPLAWPRKAWAVLDANPLAPQLILKESSRGKVTRSQPLKGMLCKTPVMALKGKSLKQPPAIQAFLHQRRFPLTLTWPDGEVDHDLIVATATSADRAAWVKALNAVIKLLKAQAPTSGWLTKQGGRKGRLTSLMARSKRRWFVLTQPDQGSLATFRYYDAPPKTPTTPFRGTVVINGDAELLVDDESKLKNAFVVTSQGANDPKPISTTLGAESHAELARWMKALRKAIADSGGEVAAVGDLMTAAGERRKQSLLAADTKHANLVQLAKLEEAELLQLRWKQLFDVAKHLGVPLDAPTEAVLKDKSRAEAERKRRLVDLIVSQRKTYAVQDNLDWLHEPSALAPAPKLRTWGSQEQMHETRPPGGTRGSLGTERV